MLSDDKQAARLAAVDEHVRLENLHDVDGIVRTFGEGITFDDRGLGQRFVGHEAVHGFYGDLVRGIPDVELQVLKRYVCDDAVLGEVIARGTHRGKWRGLPATGRRIELEIFAVFTFDRNDQIECEKVYYDRATLLTQLGVFHDPETTLGRTVTALTHPLTMARIAKRAILGP